MTDAEKCHEDAQGYEVVMMLVIRGSGGDDESVTKTRRWLHLGLHQSHAS